MKKFLQQFWADEGGLTIVEYAVGGALIVAAGVAVFTGLGDAVEARIQDITDSIS